MTVCIVTIADTDRFARTLDRYLRCFLPQIDSYFMTYNRSLLSGALMRQADLFILELMRQDDIGFRAEAVFTAEKWLSSGRRVLIVSGAAVSQDLNTNIYWDLAAQDSLYDRVTQVLGNAVAPISELDLLRHTFKTYCRPAIDRHQFKQIHTKP